MSSFVAILLLISVMSSATAAKPRSIFPSRSAKPRSTVERTLSSVALLFFVRVFAAICREYSISVVGGTRVPMVWMSRITKIGEGAHEFWKRGSFEDHADWMWRASRISTGDRRVEREVQRLEWDWSWVPRCAGGLCQRFQSRIEDLP